MVYPLLTLKIKLCRRGSIKFSSHYVCKCILIIQLAVFLLELSQNQLVKNTSPLYRDICDINLSVNRVVNLYLCPISQTQQVLLSKVKVSRPLEGSFTRVIISRV